MKTFFDKLPRESKWIDAKECNPNSTGIYLVRIQSKYEYNVARWDADSQRWYSIGGDSRAYKSVKFWCEIPKTWE